MSLFRSSLRPPAVLSDEAVERYAAALRSHVDPDPAFRRRLRGAVLNRYVASREPAVTGRTPRTMGRLGRAVLYASFALAVSVTGVMAASEVAVPGDALYPLKRAIEEMRVEVLPAQFRDELAEYELNERLSELVTLADRGDERVELLAKGIAIEYGSMIAGAVVEDGPLDRRSEVLASLIARLPDQARGALERAILAAGGTSGTPESGDGTASKGEAPVSGDDPGPPPGRATGNGNGHGAGGGASAGGAAGSETKKDRAADDDVDEDVGDDSPDGDSPQDEAGGPESSPTPKSSPGTKSKAPAKP